MTQAQRSSLVQRLRKLGLTLGAAAMLAGSASVSLAKPSPQEPGAAVSSVVSLSQLPAEAQRTERLIRAGGPFPYEKDGSVFGNRERLLPRQARGYYREYTVKTPGVRHRGARRIVCGGEAVTKPEACYYTDDHYASFRRIVQ